MRYVITGGSGHISKPIAEKLLAAGHQVTIISRRAENLKELVSLGAQAAVGSIEDKNFLAKTFQGADAAYTMVPPNDAAKDWKSWIGQTGSNYAGAIQQAGVKYVVNLSSVGAHLAEGVGPVSGLYRAEQALNALKNVNIKHLRPSYFFNNLLSNVGLIKNMDIMGSNFGGDNFKMVLTDIVDITEAAIEELMTLDFTGHSIRYIASDERNINEVAKILGTAIDKPALPWVVFSNEQAFQGMLQAGLPEEIARNYVEMGNAIHTGMMTEDYWQHPPATLGKVKLEDFAKTFATIYKAS